MERLKQTINRVLYYWRQKQFDRELEEEMRFHFEMKVEENLRAGLSHSEARYLASRQFGNQTRLLERSREMWTYNWIDTLVQDLRYAMRQLVKSPSFAVIAILSLALGIGANTSIFTLVDYMMLRTLPVKDPHQLVVFKVLKQDATSSYVFNFPLFEKFRANVQTLSGVIAQGGFEKTEIVIGSESSATQVEPIQTVSGNFFSVLGVDAVAGRMFTENDDRESNPEPVAVISYDLWRSNGFDPSIVGKKITLRQTALTIVGVAPQGFFGLDRGRKPGLWCPMNLLPILEPANRDLKNTNSSWLVIMGRLKPGVIPMQAQQELDVIYKQQMQEMFSLNRKMSDSGRRSYQARRIELEQGSTGHSWARDQFGHPTVILMIIVGLVLLLACANVANLLMARAAARQREIAVRLAVGASRLRLIRQLLTEGMLLSMIGGVFGLIFSHWGTRVLLAYLPDRLTNGYDLSPDSRILLFTMSVSTLAGILFSLVPALQATKPELISGLKGQSGGVTGRSRLFLNKALIATQVALSLFLLVGAGLFVRTLQNLKGVDLGFERNNLLQFDVRLGRDYKVSQRVAFYKEALSKLDSIPGVSSASISSFGLLDGSRISNRISVPGYVPQTDDDVTCNSLYISPRFFETMGITLLSGRVFGPQDEFSTQPGESPPISVPFLTVINQKMANHFFPEENPVGKRFSNGIDPQKSRQFEIIGVVKDTNYETLREEKPMTFYLPYFQRLDSSDMTFEVRTAGNLSGYASSFRSIIKDIDPKLQVSGLVTMNEFIDRLVVQEKFMAQIAGFFSLFALMLACIGLYGIMSYTVTQKTNEIGIRMALGARGADVIRQIMKDVSLLVAIGVSIGLIAALASTRFVASMLFKLTPTDPTTMVSAVLLLAAVAALAGFIPARRAARTDPMIALRHE